MGNRAVITTQEQIDNDGIGIYLHWNGGRDSIEGFLAFCEIKGFRSPETDNYGLARLTQVIANFFDGEGLSIGIGKLSDLDCDNRDNGTYIIGDNWKITRRMYFDGTEQNIYTMYEMLRLINDRQPEYTSDYHTTMKISTESMVEYCERHGYSWGDA